MSYETLLTELDDGVMTLTLNRPDRLNALTVQMIQDLLAVLDEIDANDEVRAVIVTGAGRGFCAGADLSGGAETFDSGSIAGSDAGTEGDAAGLESESGVPRDGGGLVTLRLFDCKKVLIAAINGPAVGVGVTMTLPMDIRIASESAKLGLVFARRGIVPEA